MPPSRSLWNVTTLLAVGATVSLSSIPAVLFFHQFPNHWSSSISHGGTNGIFSTTAVVISWFWTTLSQSDLGTLLAAVVAVGGYLVEHWIARRVQQREVQIQRVASQSSQLLVPITTHIQSLLLGSIYQFIDSNYESAESYIAVVYGGGNLGRSVLVGSASRKTDIDDVDDDDDDGENGEIQIDDTKIDNKEKNSSEINTNTRFDYGPALLKEFENHPMLEVPTTFRHKLGVAYFSGDVMRRQPVVLNKFVPAVTAPTELPTFLHRAIVDCSKPNSTLWQRYETFVRCELYPTVSKIASIIDEHGHLMERVPPERLKEMFQSEGAGLGQKWTLTPRMLFYSLWLAYSLSWQSVLSMWDRGVYDDIRPTHPFPVGILFFNIEAQTIVANLEKELVGMSQMHGSARK